MFDSYYDSAEGITIDRGRALKELDRHGIIGEDRQAFDVEMGVKDNYDAQAVLGWLGY
jgi:hypothetical protein